MKAFVLAACLLVTVYAADHEEPLYGPQNLFSTVNECLSTLPKCGNDPKDPRIRPDVWYCVFVKHGLIDDDGFLRKKKVSEYCEALSANVGFCKTIISKCMEKTRQNPEFNDEKSITLAIIECNIVNGIIAIASK